nr:GNAT family N-acetyltransferase [Acuticoccus mangrovi]
MVIRRLSRGEQKLFVEHLKRLDAEARRSRFGRAIGDAGLVRYAGRQPEPGVVLVGAFVDGVLRGVGELHPAGENKAETAFSVEPAFQGRGIGRRLLQHLVTIAQNHGIHTLVMLCLAENGSMQRITRRLGGRLITQPGEVEGIIRTPFPTPFSLAREALSEGARYASAALDWWTDAATASQGSRLAGR